MPSPDRKVRQTSTDNITGNQQITHKSFFDFVAIKLIESQPGSTGFKALKSFTETLAEIGKITTAKSLLEILKLWVVTMTDNGLTPTTRKRYFGHINALHNEYCTENPTPEAGNPFADVRHLCDTPVPQGLETLEETADCITTHFNDLIAQSDSHPSLLLFIYLLLSGSADMKSAVNLTVDTHFNRFPQLDDLLDTDSLHHRRRYLFPLQQSRKREPQILREASIAIDYYLTRYGCDSAGHFTPSLIPALWVSKARSLHIPLPQIRAIVGTIPTPYDHLDPVIPADLSAEERNDILQKVAAAFAPTTSRWYAMKLRRGVTFDQVKSLLQPDQSDRKMKVCTRASRKIGTGREKGRPQLEFFYPIRETARREGKKIVTERTPFIPDILFFKTQPGNVAHIDRTVRDEENGWVFRMTGTPGSEYSIIDNGSMRTFQKAIGQFTSDIRLALTDRPPVEVGRRVRITGGVMAGYEGMIYDIKDDVTGNSRIFYIKLSCSQYMKLEAEVEEVNILPLDEKRTA